MNDKPLRHEDYLSIAEENRRLRCEIEQLTRPKPEDTESVVDQPDHWRACGRNERIIAGVFYGICAMLVMWNYWWRP